MEITDKKSQTTPRLSVIVPVYNVEKYLEDGIKSLLSQDFMSDEYELIFINDGSSDNSVDIIKKYQDLHYNQIKLFEQENSGVSAARNLGIEKARGEWIVFFDPDDVILSGSYFSALEAADNQNSDMVFWHYKTVPEDYLFDSDSRCSTLFEQIKTKIPYGTDSACSYAVKRSIVMDNNLRFITDMKYGEDTIFTRQLISFVSAKKQILTHDALYMYRQRSNSAMQMETEEKKLQKMADLHRQAKVYNQLIQDGIDDEDWLKKTKLNQNLSVASSIRMCLKTKSGNVRLLLKKMKDDGLYPHSFYACFHQVVDGKSKFKNFIKKLSLALLRFKTFVFFCDRFSLMRKNR